MIDDNGVKIGIGDILQNKNEYRVQVVLGTDSTLIGKLICEPGHPCENIPYHLNDGKDHEVIYTNKILKHNLSTGQLTYISDLNTLEVLKMCHQLNAQNDKIKHYPVYKVSVNS